MNQNSHRRPKKLFKRQSIDGLLRTPLGFSGTDNISFRRPISYRPSTEQTVGNFNQPEGYHATDQGRVAEGLTASQSVATTATSKSKFLPRLGRNKQSAAAAKQPRIKRRGLRMALRSAAFLGVALVITGGFLFIKGYLKTRNIFKGGSEGAVALQENVDPSLLKGEGDGRVNILILGKGGDGHTAPDLTDTVLIASIDPINKDAAILSIPRDLYVKVPGDGSMKINAVYASAKQTMLSSGRQTASLEAKAEKAGLESIEKTLEDVLGIPIHYYTMIDFEGFKKAIDAVGGIDVNVTEALYETMYIDGNNYILNVKTGMQHFDGFRALAYARSRMTSVRGDFDRAERQRLLMLALKDKILSIGTFANPVKLSQLMDAFGNHIQTNLTIGEMLRLYNISKTIASDKVGSIGLADPPNDYVLTGFIDGLSVVLPRAGVGNFKEIQHYIRNTLKDGYIKNENASIVVLNGTSTAGLATLKADELKSYGYNITQIADAPTKTYSKTVLVDLSKGTKKYTKRYLEQRFLVSATDDLPDGTINPGGANFVIILGTDVLN